MSSIILFEEVRGDSWRWTIQLLEDGTENPVSGIEDTTAAQADLRKYVDNDIVLSSTSVTIVDSVEAYVTVAFDEDDTAGIKPGDYWCSILFEEGTLRRTAGPFGVRVRGGMNDLPA